MRVVARKCFQRLATAPGRDLDPPHKKALAIVSEETVRIFQMGWASKGIMRGTVAALLHDATGTLIAYVGLRRTAPTAIPVASCAPPTSSTCTRRNVSTTLIQPVTIFTLASVPMASPRFALIAIPPVRRARCGPFLVRVALSGVSWEASMAGRRGTRRRRTQRHRAVGGGDRVNLERCDGAART